MIRTGLVMWSAPYDPALLAVATPEHPEALFRAWKPPGIYYCPDDEWIAWVAENMPNWLTSNTYRVSFEDDRMLRIHSEKSLWSFHHTYCNPNSPLGPRTGKALRLSSLEHADPTFGLDGIDWPRVRSEYDGIEIAPYFYTLRYELMWYSTWDVATGIVWNRSIIQGVEPIVHPLTARSPAVRPVEPPLRWASSKEDAEP